MVNPHGWLHGSFHQTPAPSRESKREQGRARRRQLTSLEQLVLARLREMGGRRTGAELRREGETPQAVSRALVELRRLGFVNKESGKPPTWEVE